MGAFDSLSALQQLFVSSYRSFIFLLKISSLLLLLRLLDDNSITSMGGALAIGNQLTQLYGKHFAHLFPRFVARNNLDDDAIPSMPLLTYL